MISTFNRIAWSFLLSIFMCSFSALSGKAQSLIKSGNKARALIAGRIAIDNMPAQGMEVVLVNVDGKAFTPYGWNMSTTRTDKAGYYEFKGVEPGNYEVYPNTHLPIPYQGLGLLPVKTLKIIASEHISAVSFDLSARSEVGKVSGRVKAADGKSVQALIVLLVRVDENGRLIEDRSIAKLATYPDDQGKYLLDEVPPGRYAVCISASRFFAETFYPDRDKLSEASFLEVKPGSDFSDIDFTLRQPSRTFQVSGRVTDEKTGQPIANPKLVLRWLSAQGKYIGSQGCNDNDGGPLRCVIDADGQFRMTGVFRSRYALYAVNDAAKNIYCDVVKFEVEDKDVTGLELKMLQASTIDGVVAFEPDADSPKAIDLASLYVEAWVGDNGSSESPGHGVRLVTKVDATGHFRLTGLSPGTAQIIAEGEAGNRFRVARLERNGSQFYYELTGIGSGEQIDGVRLTLRQPGVNSMQGQVKMKGSGELEGTLHVSATHISDGNPVDYPVIAVVGPSGSFIFKGLQAGEYIVEVSGTYYTSPSEASAKVRPRTTTVRKKVIVAPGKEPEVKLTVKLAG